MKNTGEPVGLHARIFVYMYDDLMEFILDVVNRNDRFKEERKRVRRFVE